MEPYRSYVIRCWREGSQPAGDPAAWRFAVEPIRPGGERRGFGTIDSLVAFLLAELAAGGSRDAQQTSRRE
jgi:hypothetical protein